MTRWPDLCPKCLNRHLCAYVKLNKVTKNNEFCPGMMAYINNDAPLKEPLAADHIHVDYQAFVGRDYKDVLNEAGENREGERREMHDRIREMPCGSKDEIKRKMIAAATFFGITRRHIMLVLRMQRGAFYRLIGGAMAGKE